MSNPKRMTKQQLVREIAKRANLTHQSTVEVLEHLRDMAIEQLTTVGVFIIPELVKLTLKEVPAKPEQECRTPRGVMVVKARPAHRKVRIRPERALRESVS